MKKFFISCSILSADFSRLGEDVTKAISSGSDIVHFDVMDNHYVPGITIGPGVLKSLRKYGISSLINVHLMTKPVDNLIKEFALSGANYITFHPEASDHVYNSLNLIKSFGCKSGLAFNPSTPLNYLEYVLDKIDLILIMTVNPGLSGQNFLFSMLKKIKKAKRLIKLSNNNIQLEVDGGINSKNIGVVASMGANIFVSGSAIFNSLDYRASIRSMREELENFS